MNMTEVRDAIAKRRAGRKRQQEGNAGEAEARAILHSFGCLMVERIETGWLVHRNGFGKIVGATPLAKVAGDFRAIMPGGRSVLVEVKSRKDHLRYGDLEKHQHAALAEHAKHGGLSLVVWHCPDLFTAIFDYDHIIPGLLNKGRPFSTKCAAWHACLIYATLPTVNTCAR